MSVKASYADHAQDSARAFVAAINEALATRGLGVYEDPDTPPDVYQNYRFGRSVLDHHVSGALSRLGEMAKQSGQAPHLSMLERNPFRLAYLPIDFSRPLATRHTEQIFGMDVPISVGSAPRLLVELVSLAPELGISVENGRMSDANAEKINNFEPLYEGDDLALAEDERPAWLLMFEGARLAHEHKVALSLAG